MFTIERFDPELLLLNPQSRQEYMRRLGLGLVLFLMASFTLLAISAQKGYHYPSGQIILVPIFIYLIFLSLWFGKLFAERNEQVIFSDWSVRRRGAIAVLTLFLVLTAIAALDSSFFITETRYLLNRFLILIGGLLTLFFLATLCIRKFAIHSDGIYYRWKFYRWDRIKQIGWTGENGDLLSFTVKDDYDMWGYEVGTQWAVPAEKKPAIDRIMESQQFLQQEEKPTIS